MTAPWLLFRTAGKPPPPIRMLSITGASLVGMARTRPTSSYLVRPAGAAEENQKQENLETALDKIREKFGRESVSFGSVIHNDLGIRDHKKSCDFNRKGTEAIFSFRPFSVVFG